MRFLKDSSLWIVFLYGIFMDHSRFRYIETLVRERGTRSGERISCMTLKSKKRSAFQDQFQAAQKNKNKIKPKHTER